MISELEPWKLRRIEGWSQHTSDQTPLGLPFGVSLTERQHEGCSLNLSVNWDLNDWGGRWGLQEKQRNLLDGAGWGGKTISVWPMSALPMTLVWRVQEPSLGSCWTCPCTCLALLWLSSLLSQPGKAPQPNLSHMHWDGAMLGEEQSHHTRGVGWPHLFEQNQGKHFWGHFQKTTPSPRLWTEGSAHVSHWFQLPLRENQLRQNLYLQWAPVFCCPSLVSIKDTHRWNQEHQGLHTPLTGDSVQRRCCCSFCWSCAPQVLKNAHKSSVWFCLNYQNKQQCQGGNWYWGASEDWWKGNSGMF